jgi:hypothetical protein
MRIMYQDTGPNRAVGVMVWFVFKGTTGFDEGGISVRVEKEDKKGFVRTCSKKVFCCGDMAKLGLPTDKVLLKPSEDSFSFSSVFSIGVNLPTSVIERLDSSSGLKMFKEFPEEIKGFSIPLKVHACNLFV